jgi:hypothetical protein
MAQQSDVKTIHEFLADNPNVDVSKQWERCWNIHGKIAERILNHFDGAELHPISEGADYYTSPDGQMEGAFFGYTGHRYEYQRLPESADPRAESDDHFRHGTQLIVLCRLRCPRRRQGE